MTKNGETGAAVAVIHKRNGKLTAAIVVEAAGHEYRPVRPRTIIRVVEVAIDGNPERFLRVSTVKRQEGPYKPVFIVVEQPDDFTMAMEEAVFRLNSARRAVNALESAARDREDETRVKLSLAIESISMAQSVVRTLH